MRGHADIAPTPGGKSATLILELAGLEPGKTYVWHLGHGACTDSETASAPSDYLPLTADALGRGSSSGSFPITNTGMTGYHIECASEPQRPRTRLRHPPDRQHALGSTH